MPLATFAAGCGTAPDAPSAGPSAGTDPSSSAEVRLEKADGDEIRFSAAIGESTFEIVSRVEASDQGNGEDDEASMGAEPTRTRHISVQGDDGVVYAELFVDTSSRDVVGSLGGASFGRADDADTDASSEHWAPVADSGAGRVLRAIAAGASSLASTEKGPETSATLSELALLGRRLDVMAGRVDFPSVTEMQPLASGPPNYNHWPTPADGHPFVYVSDPVFPIGISLRGRRNWVGAMRDTSDFVGVVIYEGHLTHIQPNVYRWTYHSTPHYGTKLALVHTAFHDLCARAKGFYPDTPWVKWSSPRCEPEWD